MGRWARYEVRGWGQEGWGRIPWHRANSSGIQKGEGWEDGAMVALHNQSETIEEGASGTAFLDRADCIYAGMEARGENH